MTDARPICRSCGNTGRMFTGDWCVCPRGREFQAQESSIGNKARLAWVLEHIATISPEREHTSVPVGDLQLLRGEIERLRRELSAAYELLDEHYIQRELNPDKELYGVWKPSDDDLEAIRWREWQKKSDR